jgi:hypothetical protein
MHPTLVKFQQLTTQKRKFIDTYCEMIQAKSELENDIALSKIEFSDISNGYNDLLLLEIELYKGYQDLRDLEVEMTIMQIKIQSLADEIANL